MHPPGETQALEEFVAEIFRTVGLDWKAHANCDLISHQTLPNLLRQG
jgi:hypothetical protein